MPNLPAYVPEKIEPRCKVCQSELRQFVDKLGTMGYKPSAIARQVQEIEPELTRASIDRHLKRHVNIEQEALRQILEERARERGLLVEDAKTHLITRQAILDQLLRRTWERLANGERVPWEIGLRALELQELAEKEEQGVVIEQVTRQLSAIIQAVREIVPAEFHEATARRAEQIYKSPVLGELNAGDPPAS